MDGQARFHQLLAQAREHSPAQTGAGFHQQKLTLGAKAQGQHFGQTLQPVAALFAPTARGLVQAVDRCHLMIRPHRGLVHRPLDQVETPGRTGLSGQGLEKRPPGSESLRAERKLYTENSYPVLLPRYLVQDIDTIEDWHTAENMFLALQHKTDAQSTSNVAPT